MTTHLRRHIESRQLLYPEQLANALRRQEIYGGSLDTALLELDLVSAPRLAGWFAEACGVPPAPVSLLVRGSGRPWEAIDAELLKLAWAIPLAREGGQLQVAIHPDLPDDRLGALYRTEPGLQPLIAPECCLEALRAEWQGSVVPQRYAVLSVAYLGALRRAIGVPTGAPPPPSTTETAPPDAARKAATPTLRYGDDAPSADQASASPLPAPPPSGVELGRGHGSGIRPLLDLPEDFEHEPGIPPEAGPSAPEPDAPLPAAPLSQRPGSGGSRAPDAIVTDVHRTGETEVVEVPFDHDPLPRARFTAKGTLIAEPDAPPASAVDEADLIRRMAGARQVLQTTRARDAAIEAVVSAAMVVSTRVALFRVRGTELVGLSSPRSKLCDVGGRVVPLEPGTPVADALAAGDFVGSLGDPDLSLALELEDEPTCLLRRIEVLGRPILVLYVDSPSRPFVDAEVQQLDALCSDANEAFEAIVKARREARPSQAAEAVAPAPEPPAAPSETPPETPKVEAPVAGTGPHESWGAPSDRLRQAYGGDGPQPDLSPEEQTTATFEAPPGLTAAPPTPSTAAATDAGPPAPAAFTEPTTLPGPPVPIAPPVPTAPPEPAATAQAPEPAPVVVPEPPAPNPFPAPPVAAPVPPEPAEPAPAAPTPEPAASTEPIPTQAPLDPGSTAVAPIIQPGPTQYDDDDDDVIVRIGRPAEERAGLERPSSAPTAETDAVDAPEAPPEDDSEDDDGGFEFRPPTRTTEERAPGLGVAHVSDPADGDEDEPVDDPKISARLTVHSAPPPPPVPPPPKIQLLPPPSHDPGDTPAPPLSGVPPDEPEPQPEPKPDPQPATKSPAQTLPADLAGAVDPTGIISLASPINQPTMRGRIELEADDWVGKASESSRGRIDALVAAIAEGSGNVSALATEGDAAYAALAAKLPGPLEVLRRDLRALPPPAAHGPLIRAAISAGPPIVPHLLELLRHPNPDVRFYAAYIFQELRDDRCAEMLGHLAFDVSGDVRIISMRVLETYSRAEQFPAACLTVRSRLERVDPTERLYAARAAGTLRDTNAIARLIDLLTNTDRFIQEAAIESLCSITGQQLGLKPHRWKAWFNEHHGRHRIEWIIDSLRHKDMPVRQWAAHELGRITGHRVPLAAAADKRGREAAVRAWTDWWNAEGKARLGADRRGL